MVPAEPGGERAGGTFPLMGSVAANISRYLQYPAMNSRFYGLLRREPLLRCMKDLPSVWGADWLLIVRLLQYGKFNEVEECLFERGNNYTQTETIDRSLARITGTRLGRLFPLAAFTRLVLSEPDVAKSPTALFALLRHNLVHCALSWKTLLRRRMSRGPA
jgi:hypothetical protein